MAEADPDREISEAMLAAIPSGYQPTLVPIIAAGLCALRRVLQRDQGGVQVPENWSLVDGFGGRVWRHVDGQWRGSFMGKHVGDYPTLAQAAAAVTAARQQP